MDDRGDETSQVHWISYLEKWQTVLYNSTSEAQCVCPENYSKKLPKENAGLQILGRRSFLDQIFQFVHLGYISKYCLVWNPGHGSSKKKIWHNSLNCGRQGSWKLVDIVGRGGGHVQRWEKMKMNRRTGQVTFKCLVAQRSPLCCIKCPYMFRDPPCIGPRNCRSSGKSVSPDI